jgi:anti-anti-sigma factor
METQDGHHPARDTDPERWHARAISDQTADSTSDRRQEPPHHSATPEAFHIFESTADGRRVIAACGELDLSTAAQLEERLAGNVDTVLDLSDLSFTDSTGLHVMIRTARTARSQMWEFTVRNPQPAVLRVIKLVGLDQHLRLESQNGQTKTPSLSPLA